jgi:hypothetical protein
VVRYLHDQSTIARTVHVMTENYLFRKGKLQRVTEGSTSECDEQDGEVHDTSLVLVITTQAANFNHIVDTGGAHGRRRNACNVQTLRLHTVRGYVGGRARGHQSTELSCAEPSVDEFLEIRAL